MKTMKITSNKFKCKFCNKKYKTILDAVNCECRTTEKYLEWRSPGSGRTRSEYINNRVKLAEETKKHKKVIKMQKLDNRKI